jgi:3'(2'), 5'-bisphosphate nucleotidase
MWLTNIHRLFSTVRLSIYDVVELNPFAHMRSTSFLHMFLCQPVDPQTEADVRAQHLIVTSLQKSFNSLRIVGEEDLDDTTNQLNKKAIDKSIDLDTSIIEKLLGTNLPIPDLLRDLDPQDLIVWVDPLDGTKEYTLGHVENVTTLIGISYKGFALAGVISIPFCNQLLFAGVGIGLHVQGDLSLKPSCVVSPNEARSRHPYWSKWAPTSLPSSTSSASPASSDVSSLSVVTSRSHMTPELTSLLAELGVGTVLRAGGAGNKGVKLLQGHADAYVFPQAGTKRWDICAVQAAVEAAGGQLTDAFGCMYGYWASAEDHAVWMQECKQYGVNVANCEKKRGGAGEYGNHRGVLGTVNRGHHAVLSLKDDQESKLAKI